MMRTYKVWIQIEEIDEHKDIYRNVGEPHEAGVFAKKKDAESFIDDVLLMAKDFASRLRQLSEQGIKFLASLPDTELTAERQNREAFLKMLEDAAKVPEIPVDDRCPNCGAGYEERSLVKMDYMDINAVHMRYDCNKCHKTIIEEFTLSDVFIDDGT
jgi:hypothetical protein